MRTIRISLNEVSRKTLDIGFAGEKDHVKVIIACGAVFAKYPGAEVSMVAAPPAGDMYPVTISTEDNCLIWEVSDSDVAYSGSGSYQLTFTDDNEILKTEVGNYTVKPSLQATGEAPEPLQNWIDEATEKLGGVETLYNIVTSTGSSDIGKALSPKTVSGGKVTEWQYVSGGGGTSDYDELDNRPQIGGTTLTGNKSLADLGIASASDCSAKYTKPSGGIPTTDLASAVQTSLGKANSAYQKPGTGIPATDLASDVIPTVHNVPSGGASGKVLKKASATDYDMVWGDASTATDAQVATAVDAYLAANFSNPSNPPLDRTLLSSSSAAPADVAGTIKSAVNELSLNGYYTETSTPTDVYLELSKGGINSDGTVTTSASDRGYIWLTSAQEQRTLKFDSSTFAYNLCYKKNSVVVKYTSWSTTSPIAIDSTDHDEIGVMVKKQNNDMISSILDQIVYYTTAETEQIGVLATKSYAVAKQQNVSDSGKVLGINSSGVVVPVEQSSSVEIDDTLSVAGDAADAKKTGDTIKELAENGKYLSSESNIFYELTGKMIASNTTNPVEQNMSSSNDTGCFIIQKADIPDAICFDDTKYKANILFIKNGYQIANSYTTWKTSSPLSYTTPNDYDAIGINVRKLSGNYGTGELSTALYKAQKVYTGNLATKDYVNSYKPEGTKAIYPDGFTSRIKPNIYFNGKYYCDIDTDDYKISGTTEAWVSTTGNDTTGDGTESNPYATITKALSVSATTIHIKEGTYTQGTDYSTSVNFAGKNIIGHGTVILQNDSSGHYVMVNNSAYIENITFKHGNSTTNSSFAAICSGSGQCICFVKCVFRDSGSNGLSLDGIDAVLVECVAYGNKLDGFNYHEKTISSTTYIPNVIEIDCVSYNNGTDQSGSDSCNGSTAHDGVKIIRLNGEYYSCYGGVIAEIGLANGEPTISVNYGVLAHESTGTGSYKASFWASVNTKMYLYDCKSYGGTYDISAINDSLVVSRRLTTGMDVPAVNAASTATVYQY